MRPNRAQTIQGLVPIRPCCSIASSGSSRTSGPLMCISQLVPVDPQRSDHRFITAATANPIPLYPPNIACFRRLKSPDFFARDLPPPSRRRALFSFLFHPFFTPDGPFNVRIRANSTKLNMFPAKEHILPSHLALIRHNM
jgi:hypothetical protein